MILEPHRMREPEMETAWVEWLPQIEWQWLGTATFPPEVGASSAEQRFELFLNEVEKRMHGLVGCVAVREFKSKTTGSYGGQHFHFVLIGEEEIPPEICESAWKTVRDLKKAAKGHTIEVSPFIPDKGGLEYMFKMSHEGYGGVPVCRHLKFFNLDRPVKIEGSHKDRKLIKGFLKLQERREECRSYASEGRFPWDTFREARSYSESGRPSGSEVLPGSGWMPED